MHCIQRSDTPDPIECDTAALEVMPKAREVVNEGPRLAVKKLRTTKPAATERERTTRDRMRINRELFQELSRYYHRQTGGMWTKSELLAKRKATDTLDVLATFHLQNFLPVLLDLETNSVFQQIPSESTPGASTPTTETSESP